jgi:dipeptidyl aminopeptidase/acylaminoacyl peptidase
MRSTLLGAAGVALCGALALVRCGPVAAVTDSVGPTVGEVVEFTRIIQPSEPDPDALRAQVSPDKARAFIVTRQADVTSSLNRYRILLLDLSPERLDLGRPAAPQVVLSVDARLDDSYGEPFIREVRWADPRTLVFLARVADAPVQVYRLDVMTRELVQLTRETHPIVSFAVSGDLRRVLYAVQWPNPPLSEGAHSVVVGNQSFWSVKFGQHDLRSQHRHYRYFVAESGSKLPAQPLGDAFAEGGLSEPRVSLSPDGRWALLPSYEPQRQLEWAQRYPLVDEMSRRYGPSLGIDPQGYFSRPSGYVARRMVAYRLADGRVQTVLDAPDDASPGGGQRRQDRLWQGDGHSVVLAGTHLPPDPSRAAAAGSHIVEYWPDSGRWEVIAALDGRLQEVHEWGGIGFVAIDGERRRRFARRAEGGWREVDGNVGDQVQSRGGWTLRVNEGLNQPPDIVATAAGRSVRLTTLNPQFAAARWGTMRPYSWQDNKGRRWDGGLMGTHGAQGGASGRGRLPLVIQTYGFAPDRFYLDGPNVGLGYTSGFAGRAFLREGILVLAMPWRASGAAPADERDGVLAFMEGVRGAVDALVGEGVVDAARVGIMGWSATGERVLNLVTFSGLPIRAATLLDGDANTLFAMSVTYGASDSIWVRRERINDGLPFGQSLQRWTHNDPSLHTDCVRAALRIETYGPWVLNNWDIYALLRRQYKPAEMVVIPGGTHSLSRPAERMISLQGNVDWYRFWLKGEERTQALLPAETAGSLRDQYARWRQMELLKKTDDAKPRCARLAGSG